MRYEEYCNELLQLNTQDFHMKTFAREIGEVAFLDPTNL